MAWLVLSFVLASTGIAKYSSPEDGHELRARALEFIGRALKNSDEVPTE
jgi:hypothetical protein